MEIIIQYLLKKMNLSLWHCFVAVYNIYLIEQNVDLSEIQLQQEEVQAVRWCGKQEIVQMIEDGRFIPYHKSLIELLFAMRNHRGAHARK